MAGKRTRERLPEPTRACRAGILIALVATGLSVGHAAQTPVAPAVDYSWVPVLEPSDTVVPDPPGGRWLIDGNGLEYTLIRWRKHEGYYELEDGGKTVRLRYGLRLTVEHQDEQFLYLRWFRTAPIREHLAAAPPAGRAPDAEAPSTYRTAIPERDTLRVAAWDEGLPRSGQWRNGFAIADLNGDGHLDLVHGPPRKGRFAEPVVFLGDGAGHWRQWREARFPPFPYDYGAVAAGDLDGDGRIDLVFGVHLTGLLALRGDGKGGFTPWSRGLPVRPRGGSPSPGHKPPPSAPGFTSRALTLADWNGDGRLDILALSEGPASPRQFKEGPEAPLGKMIFLNRGDGSWQPLRGPGAMAGDSIKAADLDGDGRLDFVTDSRILGSADLVNYGEPGGTWRVGSLPQPRRQLRARAVAVGDFDRDGRLDLAVSFQSQQGAETWRGLDVFFQTAAEPRWRRVSVWAAGAGSAETLTTLGVGDLNGDGHQDLVALTGKGEVWLFVNDGAGDFSLERRPEADLGRAHVDCAGYAVSFVDLDGDGRGEIVASFAGEPGSEVLLGRAFPQRCRAGGALRVFKVVRAPGCVEQTRGGKTSMPDRGTKEDPCEH
jgi:hypothetical protein